jgi:SNF2 family DNA or RNA helicase
MSLKDLNIRGSYTGKGSNILSDFLLPSLNEAKKYDRITGYFTIDSLISIANGLDALRRKNGQMRLIIGVHSIPEEIIDVSIHKKTMENEVQQIQDQISNEVSTLSNLLDKKKIATLAWMIDKGLLNIKVASVRGEGIFHPKTMIIKDQDHNEVVAVGSSNETRNGLGGNFEQLMVATSWSNNEAVLDQKLFFETLWSNQDDEAIVFDITEETAAMIKKSLGNEYETIIEDFSNVVHDVFKTISEMPMNFFVSGNIPSLYMHQERAVVDALSRWPVRVLLSDEVGLGKTFEAAATMAYLNKYCNVKRIVILTPKSVLKQWQDELKNHFNLDVWMFDSNKKEYISPNNETISIGNRNPLGEGSPDIILMSAQYARGNKNSKGLLSDNQTILPHLLVVDEAHSARVSEDLAGNHTKTQMYRMIENVKNKIPHIILATATPMQKNALEYHAMLKLLGLPEIWEKEDNFLRSLNYIMQDSIVDFTDANKIVSLLYVTLAKMNPDLSSLSFSEKVLVDDIHKLYSNKDRFERALFVKNEWKDLKKLFIKLHPARLLTVRNTRRSLSEMGYIFPKRNLHEKTLYDSDNIKMFYIRVNEYLNDECFLIERELNPDRIFNPAFIKISYQQRVASSLYSCKKSLERRLDKIEDIQKRLHNKNYSFENLLYASEVDDLDADDLLNMDDYDISIEDNPNININNLRRAVNKEYFSLQSLVNEVNNILNDEGDKKIDESIDLALNEMQKGDSVLLFSRYTDTVDSLINVFNQRNLNNNNYNYAIYTGNRSEIVKNKEIMQCDKDRIKKALFNKEISLVICSDAASEGLNLQAARVLINVDVPWTPARLEQRIGRIARLGQTADEVDIYNVWYPNSVEAKMYHRIQSRLRNTNIAIGEFPEIIADNIKKAILNNQEDNSLEMLTNLRNDIQKSALDELWANNRLNLTYSDVIRSRLIELCKKLYVLITKDNNCYTFEVPNGSLIEFTISPGEKESVNLKALCSLGLKIDVYGLKVFKDQSLDLCVVNTDNHVIKTESIITHLIQENFTKFEYYKEYPSTLPNAHRLNLMFFVEGFNNPVPNYWIKSDGEK